MPVVAKWWSRQKEEKKCKILSSLVQKSKVLSTVIIDRVLFYQTAIVPVVGFQRFYQQKKYGYKKEVKYQLLSSLVSLVLSDGRWSQFGASIKKKKYKIILSLIQNSKVLSTTIVIDKVLFYQTAIVLVVAIWWFHQKEKKYKIRLFLIQNSKVLSTTIVVDKVLFYQTAIVPVVAIWCFHQKEKNVKYDCY